MTDHFIDPGEEHVAAVAHFALDRASRLRLVVLQLAAELGDFTVAQRVYREMIAALVIARDLFCAEHFCHYCAPRTFTFTCLLTKLILRFTAVKKHDRQSCASHSHHFNTPSAIKNWRRSS